MRVNLKEKINLQEKTDDLSGIEYLKKISEPETSQELEVTQLKEGIILSKDENEQNKINLALQTMKESIAPTVKTTPKTKSFVAIVIKDFFSFLNIEIVIIFMIITIMLSAIFGIAGKLHNKEAEIQKNNNEIAQYQQALENERSKINELNNDYNSMSSGYSCPRGATFDSITGTCVQNEENYKTKIKEIVKDRIKAINEAKQ